MGVTGGLDPPPTRLRATADGFLKLMEGAERPDMERSSECTKGGGAANGGVDGCFPAVS